MRALQGGASLRQHGFSLVELLVAVAIGLFVSLAIFQVLIASEGRKRTTTALNDTAQAAAFVSYTLDRAIRSGGSGFASAWSDGYGCPLSVVRQGTALLPSPSAFSAPFAAVTQTPVLAPVIVDQGAGTSPQASDVITVMSGNAGYGETANRVLPNPDITDRLRLRNTIGFQPNDLVLIGNRGGPCLISEVSAFHSTASKGAGQELMLGGTYYSASGRSVALSDLVTGGQFVSMLGNESPDPNVPRNWPEFTMYAVDSDMLLSSMDLLHMDGSATPKPIAEGIFRMRALYGVDTTAGTTLDASNQPIRTVNAWVAPSGAQWGAAALRSGTPAANANLRSILAIRLALIVRSPLPETDLAHPELAVVAPDTIDLFGSVTGLTETVAITEKNFRYRVVETVIPVRNNLIP